MTLPGKAVRRVARLLEDMEGSYYYCGLDRFQGFEEQVPIADKVFEKLDRRILGLFKESKRMVFFNLTDQVVKGEVNVRFLHGKCNFSFQIGHRDAKFLSLIFSQSLTKLFRELIEKRGVTDIWVANQQTYEALITVNDLKRYQNRIRVSG